jgi:hypothetical protein
MKIIEVSAGAHPAAYTLGKGKCSSRGSVDGP